MIAPFIEQMINHILHLDKDIDTTLLEGKLISLSLANTPIKWLVMINARRLSILSKHDITSAYDLDMVIEKSALMKLLKKTPVKDLLKSDDIAIIGDVKVAQALLDLITELDLDHQEILAYYTNNTIASGINQGVEFIKRNPPPQPIIDFSKKSLEKLGQLIR